MSNTSLLIVSGRKNIPDDQKRQLALSVEPPIKCIPLMYVENGNDVTNTPRDIHGFQCVYLQVRRGNNGRRIFSAQFSKDDDGNDCAKHKLVFEPDEFDRGIAYLPDTPFNRRKLVSAASGKNQIWKILDDKIRDEVEEESQKWEKRPDVVRSISKIKAKQAALLERVKLAEQKKETQGHREFREQLASITDALKALGASAQVQMLEKQLADLKSRIASGGGEDQPVVATEDVSKKGDEEADDPGLEEIKKIARREIYIEKKDLIDEIKKETPQAWAFSGRYRSEVQPLIDRRVAELKEKLKE
jgi:G:T/U-mismatch repair DNA glycosylase